MDSTYRDVSVDRNRGRGGLVRGLRERVGVGGKRCHEQLGKAVVSPTAERDEFRIRVSASHYHGYLAGVHKPHK